MDDHTTITELKDAIKAQCDARDWDQFHGPKDLAIAVVTEAAELLEPFRFKNDDEIKALFADPMKRAHIAEEAADTLMNLLRFCQMNDIDISDAVMAKMKIIDTRYPVEKAKGSNKKYNEL